MEGSQKSCYDFDHCSSSVAYATADGLLRIWEPTTSKLKHEFLPSAHLSSSCTCLKWRSQKSAATTKKAKKSRKSVPAKTDLESDVISMGTATGNINLYSVSRGEIQAQLTKVHTSTVKDVCWSSDSSHLFSASSDGLLVEWDVSSATHKRKWNSGKGGLSCIALCGQSHMISAGRSITLWDLESLTAEKTFTGHATDIVQLHTIMTDSESESIDSLYVISVAYDDRVISLWSAATKAGSKVTRAKASFILDNEPVSSTVHYARDLNTLCLAVLTISGSVEIFEYQLNGAVSKKPIKSSCCLKVQTVSGERLPVLACQLTDGDNLTIMYGTAVCPGFDHVSLDGLKKSKLTLKREDPKQSTSVTQVTAVGNIRQPKTDRVVTVLTPATEGGKKMGSKKSSKTAGEKRSLEEPEATIEERLALLKAASGDGKSNITGPVESLATLLAQALQSDDTKILNKTLQTGDVKVINTTIRRLPPTCVLPLMKHLTIRLEKYGSSQAGGITAHMSLIKWVRSLLHIHASYLATFGELMERLQRMYTIMENRVTQLGTFARLQGRLELMLSQVARQKDEVEGAEAAAALLTLQDESSEDEMMDDFDMMGANSESEDGYLSADEDDLVK